MQNRRSLEGGSPSELEDVCRCKVAIRSFIEAGWSTYAEQIILPSNRAAAAASSLQTVYDLAAKRRVGLRFNCKNLTSKCGSLRFTCNRQSLSPPPVFPLFLLCRPFIILSRVYPVRCPGNPPYRGGDFSSIYKRV